MAESGVLRDDHRNLVLDKVSAEFLAERIVQRFYTVAQKLKGGTLSGPQGQPGPNPVVQNQWGGKGIVKFNPSNDEIVQGIKQQISLFTWQSPDGLPHPVTVEVGRVASGVGGPGADGTTGGLTYVSPLTATGQGSVGGGSWPAATDAAGNPLYYRATAQVIIGTPGSMEDPFWIDINRGQRFTATASYVAVTAQMNGPPIDEATGNVIVPASAAKTYTTPYVSGSLAVYATLGMALAPSLAPVVYTQYVDNTLIPTGNGGYIRIIPPRANFLLPVMNNSQLPAESIILAFFDNAGVIGAATGIYKANTGLNTLPIPIPEDAFGLLIQDSGGLGSRANNYRLIYQLSV